METHGVTWENTISDYEKENKCLNIGKNWEKMTRTPEKLTVV